MKNGFYWIKFKGNNEITIGKYTGEGSENKKCYCTIYPWEVIASDEIFEKEEITPLCRIPSMVMYNKYFEKKCETCDCCQEKCPFYFEAQSRRG